MKLSSFTENILFGTSPSSPIHPSLLPLHAILLKSYSCTAFRERRNLWMKRKSFTILIKSIPHDVAANGWLGMFIQSIIIRGMYSNLCFPTPSTLITLPRDSTSSVVLHSAKALHYVERGRVRGGKEKLKAEIVNKVGKIRRFISISNPEPQRKLVKFTDFSLILRLFPLRWKFSSKPFPR
jgi:hypothetical protein